MVIDSRLRPKKSLGQNFCVNPRLEKEVLSRLSPRPRDHVWELGPGLGALTRLLVETGANIDGFEIDERLRSELEDLFESKVKFHWGDFLKFDLESLIGAIPSDVAFLACGNLPYYCATAMIHRLLSLSRPPDRLVFVVQEEVARKAIAQPGSSNYGFLSAQLQLQAKVIMGSVFSPSSFKPQPKVYSAILELRPLALSQAEILRRRNALSLLSIMLGQRRKMAINLLRKSHPNIDWNAVFARVGLDPTCRGESISFTSLLHLADALCNDSTSFGKHCNFEDHSNSSSSTSCGIDGRSPKSRNTI